MKRLRAAFDLRDGVAALGLILLGVGLGLESTAAGLAVPGMLLFCYAALPPLFKRQGGPS